jgi:hypothetical protein
MRRAPGAGWVKRDGLIETAVPRDAVAGELSAPATAWSWSSYVELDSGLAAPFIPNLAQIQFELRNNSYGNSESIAEVEVATGGAGSEVPYGRFMHAAMIMLGLATFPRVYFGQTYPCGPTLIPAGTRVAARIRHSLDTSVARLNVGIYLLGYDGGTPAAYAPYDFRAHLAGVHGAQSLSAPTGGTLSVTPGTPFGTYGDWVQVIASAPADLLVWGLTTANIYAGSNQSAYFHFGTGGAGSEQVRALLATPCYRAAGGLYRLARPLLVKKGERLAVRATMSANNFGHKVQVFYEEV